MKNFITLLVVALMAATPQQASAQQRPTVRRTTATPAKKTTTTTAPKKPTAPRPQPVGVVIDGPVIVDGSHLAFHGIPVIMGEKDVEAQLAERGFKKTKDTWGNTNITGTAYGVKCTVYIDNERGITVREAKAYKLAAAKKRVEAYKKAYLEATGGKETQNTLGWGNSEEGGTVVIETESGTITISYTNQDEVEFSSDDYDLSIAIFENVD